MNNAVHFEAFYVSILQFKNRSCRVSVTTLAKTGSSSKQNALEHAGSQALANSQKASKKQFKVYESSDNTVAKNNADQ